MTRVLAAVGLLQHRVLAFVDLEVLCPHSPPHVLAIVGFVMYHILVRALSAACSRCHRIPGLVYFGIQKELLQHC